MTDPDLKDHWTRVYADKSEDEVSWFQERPETSLTLIDRANLLPEAAIVDVGGGSSRLVDCLLARDYRNLTVLDIAEAALDRARRRIGPNARSVTWIAADILDWQPPARFDLWHDRAVFHFLTEAEDRLAYRAQLERNLTPGGTVIIGTFAPDGPERCSGLPVVRYAPETLTAELGDAFIFEDCLEESHTTPAGRIQNFQFSRFRFLGGDA